MLNFSPPLETKVEEGYFKIFNINPCLVRYYWKDFHTRTIITIRTCCFCDIPRQTGSLSNLISYLVVRSWRTLLPFTTIYTQKRLTITLIQLPQNEVLRLLIVSSFLWYLLLQNNAEENHHSPICNGSHFGEGRTKLI